jgi:hypothetical protein
VIANDTELKCSQERIAYFQDLLAKMRLTAPAETFPLMAGGYRAEIERMQAEVLDYLTRPANPPVQPASAEEPPQPLPGGNAR